MVAMGLVPMPKNSLGFEATGTAKRVGSNIDHVRLGDRVLVIHTGLFATTRVVPGLCVAKIPENLSSEEAVTIPVVYATVIHCLISIGQLKKGQVRVLFWFTSTSIFQATNQD
jgi:NADPH:quinone reductase-like Zn-dependent oxidoreductase